MSGNTKHTPRVHLLLGPETGEKGARLKEIRGALRTEFSADPEIYRFYPFETLNGEIFTALQNNSLFSEHRLVILSQAELLQSSQIKELEAYLEEPSDSATLVIISSETRVSQKIASRVPKSQTKIFWEMFENRKPEWVRGLFSRSDFAITGDAVDMMLELVENTTQELRATALQLMQFVATEHRATVTEDDVERFIQHTRQESVFSLFEHMATGSYERALDILHTLIRSGDGDPIPLLAGLLWQFRRLVSLEELLAEGHRWDDAVNAVSIMGKTVAIKRKKDLGIYAEAVKRYPLRESRSIIAAIGEYDMLTRQMGSDLHSLLLERLLGRIMVNKGADPAQLETLSFATDAKF